MSVRYDIDFEAGDFSEFDTDNSGAELYVSAVDPITGNYSAVIEWTASNQFVLNTFSSIPPPALGTSIWRVGFRITVNSFSFGTVTTQKEFFAIVGSGVLLTIGLKKSGSDIIVFVDDTVSDVNGTTDVSGGEVFTVEVRCVRATSAPANDGILQLFINGSLEDTATDHDNYNDFLQAGGYLNFFRFRILAGTGHAGSLKFDDFIFRDDDTKIYPNPLALPVLASMKAKIADIDADGTFVYIALIKDSTPILTKISTALNANGTTVFSPNIGNNIGVQCGNFDANIVWVAGNFGGTDVVEKSEDAGSSFSVKDPATFGNVTTFVVGPEDERILLVDDTADIQETEDDGVTWTEKNSVIGFVVNALARFSLNFMRIVLGNASAVNDNIDYSPNVGIDLEDYSTGLPQSDVTDLVVR